MPRLLVRIATASLKLAVRPLPVRQPTRLKHLQQHIHDTAVCLLDLIEQHDDIRLLATRSVRLAAAS